MDRVRISIVLSLFVLVFIQLLSEPALAATRAIQLKPGYNFIGLGASVTQQQLESAGCVLGNWSRSNKLWQHYNMAENFFTVVQGTTELTRLTSTQTEPWLGYMIYEESNDGCSFTVNEQAETTLVLAPGYNLVSIPTTLAQSQIEASGCQLGTWAKSTKRWDHFDSSEKLFTIVEGVSYLTRITTTTMEPYKAYLIYNSGSSDCTIDLTNLPTTTSTTTPTSTTTTTTKPTTTTTAKTTTTTKPTTTTRPSTSYDYMVSVSGSTYYVKDPNGKTTPYNSATSAIQAALNAVGAGQTIYISGGTYPITAGLSGSKNDVTITGDSNTIIKATQAMGYMFLWMGSSGKHLNNFHLNNIKFDGGRTTSWPDTGTTGLATGPKIEYVDHVVVDGITVQNTKRTPPIKGPDGLSLQGATGAPVTDYEVKNSHFSNIYGSGIAAAYITHLNIHDNTFVDCAQWYPIGGAVYAGDEVGYVTITHNDMSGHTDNDGIYAGTSRNFATNVIITQNTMSLQLYYQGGGDYNATNPGGYAGSGIKLYGIGGEIASNTINWNNAHYDSWPVYVGGISLWGHGANVHDNTISNAKYGIESWTGFSSTGNHVIKSNHISGCTWGIYLTQTGSTVTGNTITGCTTPIYNAGGNTVN